jgi:hypothetical protein
LLWSAELNVRIEVLAMTPQHLRLEASDGLATKDYRLCDGSIEVRCGGSHSYAQESTWQRLTPEQLSEHVRHSDVVSKWLEHRVGWRRLLQMCVPEESHPWAAHDPASQEHAEMQAV